MVDGRYQYDENYQETLVLADGTKVQIRLVRAEDAALLEQGFSELSPESRHNRFFASKRRLSPKEVEYLTHLDNEDHLAIGALKVAEDGHEHGLGVARFIRFLDRPDTADVAVTVIDAMQQHGLGTALCRRLIEAATERGFKRLRFDVLASNHAMLSLLHELSPDVREHAVEDGVIMAEIRLA